MTIPDDPVVGPDDPLAGPGDPLIMPDESSADTPLEAGHRAGLTARTRWSHTTPVHNCANGAAAAARLTA